MTPHVERIRIATEYLRDNLVQSVDTAIILGTGLSEIITHLDIETELEFNQVPGLTETTVPGHQGKFIMGKLGDRKVLVCQGRLHLYEGNTAQQVAMPVYLLGGMGVQTLLVTNASGALNQAYQPADIMVINDHINFTGQNPLRGEDDTLGSRFTDMSEPYDKRIAAYALRIGSNLGLGIHTGVYAGVLGPSLETSAERRMLRQWGADTVGMSTVMEVIAARHLGIKVLGLSAITNLALGDANQQVDTIEAVLENAALADAGITQIMLEGLNNQF
ncbi:MAG: purine-nucleoside phosphorylase [Pseudomonadota bacterium]